VQLEVVKGCITYLLILEHLEGGRRWGSLLDVLLSLEVGGVFGEGVLLLGLFGVHFG